MMTLQLSPYSNWSQKTSHRGGFDSPRNSHDGTVFVQRFRNCSSPRQNLSLRPSLSRTTAHDRRKPLCGVWVHATHDRLPVSVVRVGPGFINLVWSRQV